MAYTAPNPDQFIVGHVSSTSRKGVWDHILGFLTTASDNYDSYLIGGKEYSRHSAIRKLREERGVHVIRVKVVAL